MKVLVLNCGSSSLKYRLIEMPGEVQLAYGEAQRVGPPTAEPSRILHTVGQSRQTHTVSMPDHAAAFAQVMKLLTAQKELSVDAVGHRMVHGGARFADHAIIDERALAALDAVAPLAPLHNPPAIALIKACRQLYPGLPQVAVIDTVFHATIPVRAQTYALPAALRQGPSGFRKYGFHGTSHQYVAGEVARLLGKPLENLNAVSCHLGSGGASLCAIVGGRSVDNTMGYSPTQGLLMSTRCGDLDPAVVLTLLSGASGNAKHVEDMLNKRSGVLGMYGKSADIRDVLAASDRQDAKAQVTAQTYLWRIRKYLGAYLAVVHPADAVIFTDTIGQEVPAVRWAVCSGMEALGLQIDADKNASVQALPADIASRESSTRVLVIETNEELAIARQSYRLLLGGAQVMERKAS
jgi:acetate kinase